MSQRPPDPLAPDQPPPQSQPQPQAPRPGSPTPSTPPHTRISPPSAAAVDAAFRAEDAPREKVDVGALHDPIMREQRDPRDGYEPVPLWLVAFFGALLFWGGWYLATYSGGFDSNVLDERPQARFAAANGASATTVPAPSAMDVGKELFIGTCAACHTVAGTGQPGVYPPLAGSEWVGGNPDRLARIVMHGLAGPITVGNDRYVNAMPPLGTRYTDEQIAAILTYIRGNSEWGNNAPAVAPEQVAAVRKQTAGRLEPWTAEELLAIPNNPAPTTGPVSAPKPAPAPASAPVAASAGAPAPP